MAVFALALLLTGLVSSASAQVLPGCADPSSYSESKNYFPDANLSAPFALPVGEVAVNTAMDFAVGYSNSYKVVKNNFANTSYVLYQCGTPKPALEKYPLTTRFFEVPLKNSATDGSLLGVLGSIKRIDTSLVSSPCVQKLAAQGKILQLESSYGNATVYAQQLAKLTSLIETSFAPSNVSKTISFDATTDPGPLKRAEWIKFLGIFFNLEARANEVYTQIEDGYSCLNGSAPADATKPVVAWLSFFDGVWTVSGAAYKLQFDLDAGAENLDMSMYGDFDMTNSTQAAAFSDTLKTLDIVIDESYAVNPPDYTLRNFTTNAGIAANNTATYKFLANKAVWRNDRRMNPAGGLDFYEGATAQPQVVLQDLLRIFHGNGSESTFYFRNLAKGEANAILTADQCTGTPTAAADPVVISCPIKISSPGPTPAPASPPKGSVALGSTPLVALAVSALAVIALVL
eukprot:jgi/Mesen1/5102/ME000253S04216